MPMRRILFLADPAEQARLRPALEAGGWDVMGAATLAELLSAVARLKLDLFLLCDSAIVSPALQALRDQQLLARIPAVVIADGDPQRYLALGVSHVLPADPASLVPLLRSAFEECRLRLAMAQIRDLGGDAFVQELADIFRDHAPKQVATARQALAAGDLETVRRTCHSLKSSAGNIGAIAVQDLAERAEDLAHQREPDLLPQLLNDIDDTLQKFLAQLPLPG